MSESLPLETPSPPSPPPETLPPREIPPLVQQWNEIKNSTSNPEHWGKPKKPAH